METEDEVSTKLKWAIGDYTAGIICRDDTATEPVPGKQSPDDPQSNLGHLQPLRDRGIDRRHVCDTDLTGRKMHALWR